MATYQSKRPYAYGTGRRKSSTARVHLIPNGTGSITINGRTLDEYFGLETLKLIVRQPLAATETTEKFDVEATVAGGCWVGICGELGGDPALTKQFVDMGVDELSVSPRRILPLRAAIRKL